MAFINRLNVFKTNRFIKFNDNNVWRLLSVLDPKNGSNNVLNRIERRNVSNDYSLLTDLENRYNTNFKGMSSRLLSIVPKNNSFFDGK